MKPHFVKVQTMNTSMKPAAETVIADIQLADWGRKEIAIAETEMPV